MKSTRIRFFLLFCIFASVSGVACLLLLNHLNQVHDRGVERAQFVNDVVSTLERGILLQAIVSEYRKQSGSFPSWTVLTNIGSQVYRDLAPPLFQPSFYRTNLNAKMNWVYVEPQGEIRLKSNRIIIWEDGRKLDPSSFSFSTRPVIPGFTLSEFGMDNDFTEIQNQASKLVAGFLKRK